MLVDRVNEIRKIFAQVQSSETDLTIVIFNVANISFNQTCSKFLIQYKEIENMFMKLH
jgi:hypothetical protein